MTGRRYKHINCLCSKIKMLCKKNSSTNWGCGFMDAPLIDTDDQVVETTQLGDVNALHVRNKHHNHDSDND